MKKLEKFLNESTNDQYDAINEGLFDRIKAKTQGISTGVKAVAQNIKTSKDNIKTIGKNLKSAATGTGNIEKLKKLEKISDIKKSAGTATFKTLIGTFSNKVIDENAKLLKQVGDDIKKYPDIVKIYNNLNNLIKLLQKFK